MSEVASLTAGSIRAILARRCTADWPTGAWRDSAAAVGVSGADSFLCHLSRSIAAALEDLTASAADACVRLQPLRHVHAEHKATIDELEASVSAAELAKRVALERELCAVDAALELVRAERSVVSEAAASLGNLELVAQHAELTRRLDAADATLLALPTSVAEPAFVGLVIAKSAISACMAAFGRVVAPLAVSAADLAIAGVPRYTHPGHSAALPGASRRSARLSVRRGAVRVSARGSGGDARRRGPRSCKRSVAAAEGYSQRGHTRPWRSCLDRNPPCRSGRFVVKLLLRQRLWAPRGWHANPSVRRGEQPASAGLACVSSAFTPCALVPTS